jgi:cell division protein FtsI (penicillin-binding protein 3)
MLNQAGSAANAQGSAPPQVAQPFRLGEELPNPLPQGAHRVISEMSAAEMRKMMEGVVLYGTGKPAQLNGYSSGGKTGTAQKIDPATHLYSKTMHIASFAGIAPVNNPAIAVAVIIDNPKGASYYGTAVSAPVFAEVAQQVLEYLGVPHDIDVQQPKPATGSKKKDPPATEDDSASDQQDVNELFAAVNDLPADDPLRTPPVQPAAAAGTAAPSAATTSTDTIADSPTRPSAPQPVPTAAEPSAATGSSPDQQATPRHVTISDGRKLTVPSLVGLPVRKVIEAAEGAGLDVQIVGNGIAREQAPAPGAQVPTGTKIVVRCGQ